MPSANRSPNSRHGEFPKWGRDGNRGPAYMMHDIEVHLVMEGSSLVVSLFHPMPVVETNPPFLIGPGFPIIEAGFRDYPNELDTVIRICSKKSVDTVFVFRVSNDPDLMEPRHLPSPVPGKSGL